jgi:hypothetical protein
LSVALRKSADPQAIQRILKIADPMIVHAPNHALPQFSSAIIEVKNSGAEVPIAINVAPATSSLSFHLLEITSSALTKYSSHTTDNI